MKKITLLVALGLASCATQLEPSPNSTTKAAEYDAKSEKALGESIGYIFAAPEKVSIRIGREFAAFDSDFTGELSTYEFSKWLIPLHELRYEYDEKPMTLSDDDLQEWSMRAHAFADADHNGEVSQSELTRYFGGT